MDMIGLHAISACTRTAMMRCPTLQATLGHWTTQPPHVPYLNPDYLQLHSQAHDPSILAHEQGRVFRSTASDQHAGLTCIADVRSGRPARAASCGSLRGTVVPRAARRRACMHPEPSTVCTPPNGWECNRAGAPAPRAVQRGGVTDAEARTASRNHDADRIVSGHAWRLEPGRWHPHPMRRLLAAEPVREGCQSHRMVPRMLRVPFKAAAARPSGGHSRRHFMRVTVPLRPCCTRRLPAWHWHRRLLWHRGAPAGTAVQLVGGYN